MNWVIVLVCLYAVLGGIRQDFFYRHYVAIIAKIIAAVAVCVVVYMTNTAPRSFVGQCTREMNGAICTLPDGTSRGYLLVDGKWFSLKPDTISIRDTVWITVEKTKKKKR
jgi:hypothetical protein